MSDNAAPCGYTQTGHLAPSRPADRRRRLRGREPSRFRTLNRRSSGIAHRINRSHRTGRALHGGGARARACRPTSAREAKHRILDTLGAIVSGARLKPGEMAIRYVRAQGGIAEASVLTTDIRTSAVNAALANGMFAHADETDDFEPVTKAHPGLRRRARGAGDGRTRRPLRARSCSAPSRSATTCAAAS